MKLEDFYRTFRNEVHRDAGLEQGEAFLCESFTRRYLDALAESGEIADAELSYYAKTGLRVDAFAADDSDETLDLFIAIQNDTESPVRLEKAKVDAGVRNLAAFYAKAAAGLHGKMEEVEPAFGLAQIIYRNTQDDGFSRVRLFIISDGVWTSERVPEAPAIGDAQVSVHVWDIERLFRWYTSGRDREQIVIDLDGDNLLPVRCLEWNQKAADYITYMAIFPAEVLVSIYGKFGPRLLERNVRSFLQARGEINRGIRATILQEPDRFLAYNNGLTATAAEIEVTRSDDGALRLKKLVDLQIVNGGQTTASLFSAARKDKADVSHIAVQVKLNLVRNADDLDDFVGQISKFANSQNKVSVSDLSANDPFNRRLEELSRTTWAPAREGAQRETKWFYERARAQYVDELSRRGTPSQRSRLEREYPRSQLFGKTDVAKYELAWEQWPHIVSRGAQKCFKDFKEKLAKRGAGYQPDESYYRHLIARKILFDAVEDLVRRRGYGGYKAQIVAYTISLVSRLTARRFDFESIWKKQSVAGSLLPFLQRAADAVQDVIANPPKGKDVTEWYKSEQCWQKCVELELPLPKQLKETVANASIEAGLVIDSPTPEEDAEINWVKSIPPGTWFSIAAWAKETGSLESWQRSISFGLGQLAGRGRSPSRKQAVQGRRLHDEAVRLGFNESGAKSAGA